MIKMSLRNLMVLALSVSLVIGSTLTVGCVRERVAIIEDITPQEAFTLIQENEDNPDFVIIDMRTPGEFIEEHIEGAINIDCTNEAFRDELDKLDRNKTYLIYAYCACGGVGWNASRTMEELGFKKVCNMWGGIGNHHLTELLSTL